MSEVINKYVLMAPFHNRDAGFCKWTLAKKDGREFFIKEFLNPVYPTDSSIYSEFRESSIQNCKRYEKSKRKLYSAINDASDGNVVRIEEFFRCDNHYYMVTERIAGPKLTPEELQRYSFDQRILLCETVAHSMMKMHEAGIVHADIKLSNILLKRTVSGNIIGKVIDFDSSFFENDPPVNSDDLVGDQVYMSPEACLFMCEEPTKLTCKMDVFSLGLLFHQYLTGELPKFDTAEYDYAFDYVLDGNKLTVSSELPPALRDLLSEMLEEDPMKRPSMTEVCKAFGIGTTKTETDNKTPPVNRPATNDSTVKKPEDYFKVVKD